MRRKSTLVADVSTVAGRRYVRNKDVVLGMPVDGVDEWDDGNVVTWLVSPFPYARKPNVPERMHRDAVVERVSLNALTGTQRRVTESGVRRYLRGDDDALPLIYRLRSSMFIADGHHRLSAALLRGERTVMARVVDITGVAR